MGPTKLYLPLNESTMRGEKVLDLACYSCKAVNVLSFGSGSSPTYTKRLPVCIVNRREGFETHWNYYISHYLRFWSGL